MSCFRFSLRLRAFRASAGQVCAFAASLYLAATVMAAGADAPVADAAEKMDRAMVRTLVQRHVDVNIAQVDGMTALHWATYQDDLETAALLVRAGANVKAANRYGVTPLSLACTNANAAMVELLLKAGADPNLPLPGGETPLMTAARVGTLASVKALLAGEAWSVEGRIEAVPARSGPGATTGGVLAGGDRPGDRRGVSPNREPIVLASPSRGGRGGDHDGGDGGGGEQWRSQGVSPAAQSHPEKTSSGGHESGGRRARRGSSQKPLIRHLSAGCVLRSGGQTKPAAWSRSRCNSGAVPLR